MRVDIQSVTLSDGTVISVDDVENNVPAAARNYIDNPHAPNAEANFIRECIDSNYPFVDEYKFKALDKALKDVNALCHKLATLAEQNRGLRIPIGVNAPNFSDIDVPTDTAAVDWN